MRTDRISFEHQPVFERIVVGLIGIGAVVGVCVIPFIGAAQVGGPVTLSLVTALALLGASTLRGSDDTLPLSGRVFGVFAAVLIGYCFQSVTAMVVALGAVTGLAMAGVQSLSPARQALGIFAGVLGALWALAASPALIRLVPELPLPLKAVAGGVSSAIFLGAALGLLHLRVHADVVGARLKKVGGETGARLERTWDRCHRSLRAVPASARREVLALLEVDAREAQRLAALLVTIDARLVAADRKDAESQVALLKNDVAQATDAMARARLSSAVTSLSDSLEALDAMERKRERLDADLKLKLATLERSALALEAAQGAPGELKSLVLRLARPAEASAPPAT